MTGPSRPAASDHRDDLAEWNARGRLARLTYWAEQDNPPKTRRCRACGSDLTYFRACPCRLQENP